MSRIAPAALLDPALLAGVDDLALLARTVVDGVAHGTHRARGAGLSLDFAQHRAYQPGDDLRRLDWRLYGRTDRFHLKTYEAESSTDVVVALDVSASMDFGSGPLTKFAWSRILLAAVAWLARRQGDRVGLLPLGGGGLADAVPAAARHLPLVLETLARLVPSGTVRLGEALERLAAAGGRRGILVVASDCYDEPEAIARGIGALRARGWDVALFHVLDPAERRFDYEAGATFADLETAARLAVEPEQVRSAYCEAIAAHESALEVLVGAHGGERIAADCTVPLDAALRQWLARRGPPIGRGR